MKNKFNNLTSKEWLPFQKSWFKYETDYDLYEKNIRFFTKNDISNPNAIYFGHNYNIAEEVCKKNKIKLYPIQGSFKGKLQYVIFDLRQEINESTTFTDYKLIKEKTLNNISTIYDQIEDRRFVSVFLKNIQIKNNYYPYAWDLGKSISNILSLKDEKIACFDNDQEDNNIDYFKPSKELFYCLNFRKDDDSQINKVDTPEYFNNITQHKNQINNSNEIPSWFILKPQRRNKNEILHPAKYPEVLVELFLDKFTEENGNIFDPMTGSGSTQLAAIKAKRNGYGTELSEYFSKIANKRCREYVNPSQGQLFFEEKDNDFKILCKDARLIKTTDFPQIDYIITSPPYWDMLNMVGAENQAKRKEKGLQTNYSNDLNDLGNISDYDIFINDLCEIYFKVIELLKPGAYLTIVVKNIKKGGRNYPFAWDLAAILQKKIILLPEVFWCQDDINIAPYGYGNTWVSNTFHQYCLNFQKPI